MQVGSRLWLLWGIVDAAPAAALTRYEKGLRIGGLSLPFNFQSMLVAWGLSEAIRYSFFSVKVWLPPHAPCISAQSNRTQGVCCVEKANMPLSPIAPGLQANSSFVSAAPCLHKLDWGWSTWVTMRFGSTAKVPASASLSTTEPLSAGV